MNGIQPTPFFESTMGIFFDSHELLGLNTAMEDEQGEIHFVSKPTGG